MHRPEHPHLSDYRLNVLVERGPRPLPGDVACVLHAELGSRPRWVRPLHHGSWSWAYTFEVDGRPLVARFSPVRHHYEKDREAAGLVSGSIPAPRVRVIGRAFGGYFAVSDRLEGGFIDRLPEAELLTTLPAVVELVTRLRRVDLDARPGYGIWHPGGQADHPSWRSFLGSVVRDVPREWRDPSFETAADRLGSLLADCPEQRFLVHSDLVNHNLLVREGVVSGVLDWGWSRYGDSLYDLARFCFLAPERGWDPIVVRSEVERLWDARGLDVASFDERLLCYQLHVGLVASLNSRLRGDLTSAVQLVERTAALVVGGSVVDE